jgi:hypothetical protein
LFFLESAPARALPVVPSPGRPLSICYAYMQGAAFQPPPGVCVCSSLFFSSSLSSSFSLSSLTISTVLSVSVPLSVSVVSESGVCDRALARGRGVRPMRSVSNLGLVSVCGGCTGL